MNEKDKELLKNFTVLFVDDDNATRKSMGKILSKFFKEVYTAANGLEGFNQFKENSPDIVITDLIMPVADGITMSRMIREINMSVPIVVISAHNIESYETYKEILNLFCFLKKPYTIQDFEKSIICAVNHCS